MININCESIFLLKRYHSIFIFHAYYHLLTDDFINSISRSLTKLSLNRSSFRNVPYSIKLILTVK